MNQLMLAFKEHINSPAKAGRSPLPRLLLRNDGRTLLKNLLKPAGTKAPVEKRTIPVTEAPARPCKTGSPCWRLVFGCSAATHPTPIVLN